MHKYSQLPVFAHLFSIYLNHFPKVSTSVNTHWLIGLWDTFLTCELSHSWSFSIIVATQNLEELSNGIWYLVFNTCTPKSRDIFSFLNRANTVEQGMKLSQDLQRRVYRNKWFNQKYGTMLYSYIYWYTYRVCVCSCACMRVCVYSPDDEFRGLMHFKQVQYYWVTPQV